MSSETVILGIFWIVTVIGAIGGIAAFISLVRAGGGYQR